MIPQMKYLIFLLFPFIQHKDNKLQYDIIIRNGMIYDGNGGKPFKGDIAINADTIAAIGNLGDAQAIETLDAKGMAVAPGFINMLSWANESLIEDGRSQSDIRQGVWAKGAVWDP
jgi:N-acyl-D-amino-acid deacylase